MEWPFDAGLSVTIGLALLGYLATYGNNLRLAQRKERLDRVERQLREFYGPLLALSEASSRAWVGFRAKYRPGRQYWGAPGDEPTAEEAEVWREWMTHVFQPINEKMALLIEEHADLVDGSEMPDPLLDLYAHVVGYRPVLEAWKRGDYSLNTSLMNTPAPIVQAYAQKHYARLKAQQARLTAARR